AQNHNGHKAKWRMIALENSFHGRTFGALATTGQQKYRKTFAPLMPGVSFVALNDLDDLKRQFDGSVCAICLETIQGEGGVFPVSPEFLRLARELTQKHGALLIIDEIQCGLGRTGQNFAYQDYGVQPDIVTVAKPLAAGLPLGAILTSNQVASQLLQEGIIINRTHETVLRFLPPYIIQEKHVDQVIKALDSALARTRTPVPLLKTKRSQA